MNYLIKFYFHPGLSHHFSRLTALGQDDESMIQQDRMIGDVHLWKLWTHPY
ncbi:hypothetical protein J2T16_004698 [Paenibacillus intestini]|nr:hypothetical protein [Paenibacillus intestini]